MDVQPSATFQQSQRRERYCGCDETPKRGTFFAVTHDRRAEARAIRERFGDIAWQLLP